MVEGELAVESSEDGSQMGVMKVTVAYILHKHLRTLAIVLNA